jgi:hypothetical protein
VKTYVLLVLLPLTVFGQGVTNPDPHWQTRGAGPLSGLPATCRGGVDVYPCTGAGCTGGNRIFYCTSTNVWDAQGTLAGGGVTSINGLIAATQVFTKTDDTNVTLTMTPAGSTHNFALGWTGLLSPTRGGTGLSTFTSGGLVYATSASTLSTSTVLGSGVLMTGGGAGGAPTTIPATGLTGVIKVAAGVPSVVSGTATDCVTVNGSTTPCVTSSGMTTLNTLTTATQTLVKTDDTNVTLGITSGGSTHTFAMGWTGTLAVGRGGTGLNTYTSGGVLYASGGTTLASSAVLGSGVLMTGGGAGAAPTTTLATGLTGVLKVALGVPSVVAGVVSDCVRVDGSSGACGGGGSATTPGGATSQIQYNNAGAFGASANLAYSSGNLLLNAGNLLMTGTPGTNTEFQLAKSGATSPTNIMYAISHRNNDQDLYLYQYDGSAFSQRIQILYTGNTVIRNLRGGLTTTMSGLTVDCGSLPSSPANGDYVCDSADSNKVKVRSNGAWVTVGAATGGAGTPAGATTQIQYNNAGAFGADAGLFYTGTGGYLFAPSIVSNGGWIFARGLSGSQERLLFDKGGGATTSVTNWSLVHETNNKDFRVAVDDGAGDVDRIRMLYPSGTFINPSAGGNLIVGSATDDGTNRLQVNGQAVGTRFRGTGNGTVSGLGVTCAVLPSSPANGDYVCDSADSNQVKVRSNGTWITVGSGTGGGLSFKLDNAAVGSRPTLNVLSGSGLTTALLDTGTEITLQNDLNTAVAATHSSVRSNASQFFVSAGTSTAYTGSSTRCITSTGDLVDGLQVLMKPHTNGAGGATTLNYCGIASKKILTSALANPASGDISATGPGYRLTYYTALDSGSGAWVLPQAGGGTSVFSGARLTNTSMTGLVDVNSDTVPVPFKWLAEDFDTDSYHDLATNTERLVIPTGGAGYYVVTCQIWAMQNAAGTYIPSPGPGVQIRKNGSGGAPLAYFNNANMGYPSLGLNTGPVLLAAGDYLECTGVTSTSGFYTNGPPSFFSIVRVK